MCANSQDGSEQESLTPNNQCCLSHKFVNWLPKYYHQILVEEDCLCCSPAKEDQHDVLEEGSHQATEGLHWCGKTSYHKHHIETKERDTDVD